MKAEKDFLVGCLTRAGIKSRVLKSWKELERYADSHVGAVLSEGQVLARDGSKRIQTKMGFGAQGPAPILWIRSLRW